MGNKAVSEKDAKEYLRSEKIYDKIEQAWVGVTGSSGKLHDSHVNMQQFTELLGKGLSQQDTETLFNLYDLNQDKTVSWKEYVLLQAGLRKGSVKMPPLASEAAAKLGDEHVKNLKRDWLKVTGGAKVEGTSINYDQFKQLMQSLPDTDLKAIFRMYDADHSGSITWAEYVSVVVRLMAGSTEEKVRVVFDSIDDNADGFLTKAELENSIKVFNTESAASAELVATIFKKYDTNNDKKIDFKEFVAFVKSDISLFAQIVGTFNPLGSS